MPVKDFVEWTKHVGGKWWGYPDQIRRGDYSDDTQLSLAVARSVDQRGRFSPEKFGYFELPLWLHYERGGGRAVKAAARTVASTNLQWFNIAYKNENVNYHEAGGNGAAMRNLPIALASLNDENRLILDSFRNSIITHGHPRAIVGAILFALVLRYVFTGNGPKPLSLLKYLKLKLGATLELARSDRIVGRWITDYDDHDPRPSQAFPARFLDTIRETFSNLEKIPEYLTEPMKDYYEVVGALDEKTRGSGISTVCAAIYDFLKFNEDPETAILSTVNMIGSDTDTIASFVGALMGAQYGLKAIPSHLENHVQDREYILKTADQLFEIMRGTRSDISAKYPVINRRDSLMRILAWEIGLHEMFWDAISVNGIIAHPTLGRGRIADKRQTRIAREGYVAKLLYVNFDSGQSCVFHSRVKANGIVSGSLAKEAENALRTN